MGDYIVSGEVLGDQFYLYKQNLKNDMLPIILKDAGKKERKPIYSETKSDKGQNTKDAETTQVERQSFILSDEEIETPGNWCLKIEEHYEKPMDIE